MFFICDVQRFDWGLQGSDLSLALLRKVTLLGTDLAEHMLGGVPTSLAQVKERGLSCLPLSGEEDMGPINHLLIHGNAQVGLQISGNNHHFN